MKRREKRIENGEDKGSASVSATVTAATTSPMVEINHEIVFVNRMYASSSSSTSPVSIRNGFDYLLIIMHLCGMTFNRNESSVCKFRLQVILFSLLLAISWANVIRYIFAYKSREKFSPDLMVKVTTHVLYILNALVHTCLIWFSLQYSQFFDSWQKYHEKYEINCEKLVRNIRKNTIKYLILLVFAIVCIATGQVIEVFTNSPFGLIAQKPFSSQYKHLSQVPIGNRLAIIFLYTLLAISNFLLLGFMILGGLALRQEFQMLTNDYNKDKDGNEIEALRLRHFQVSLLVKDMDRIVSPVALAVFICCIPSACFEIYLLVVWDLPSMYKVFLFLSLCVHFALLLLVTVVSILLNDAVSNIINLCLNTIA